MEFVEVFKRRSFKLAAMSAVIAGIAAFFILNALISKKEVVTAKVFIPAGVPIQREWLSVSRIAPDSVYGTSSVEELLSKSLSTPRFPGDQFTPDMFKEGSSANSVDGIDPLERVISIPVDRIDLSGGYLKKGDKIDLIAIYGGDLGSDVIAETVLKGSEVISFSDSESSEADFDSSDYVVVRVSQYEAELLSLLGKIGSFKVVGRPQNAVNEDVESISINLSSSSDQQEIEEETEQIVE
jgi:Flp pilus assembly protein CpaB